jgi:branched-chain amino acid transport system permease protein
VNQLAQQIANGIMAGSIYGLLAVALALIFGVLEISQFAIGAMAMLGGYVVQLLTGPTDYWIALAAATVAIAALGVVSQAVIFAPLRNAPPATIFVASFGLLLVIQGSALVVFGPDPRTVETAIEGGFVLFGASITYQRLMIVLVVLAAVIVLNWMLRSTPLGRRIQAVGQSRTGAQVVGISSARIALVTMGIGSALAGLAGGLLAPISQVYPTAGSDLVIKAFVIIVLAGMGSTTGALLAAYVIGLAESLGAAYISLDFTDLYSVVLLLVVLVLRPSGIFGKGVERA